MCEGAFGSRPLKPRGSSEEGDGEEEEEWGGSLWGAGSCGRVTI